MYGRKGQTTTHKGNRGISVKRTRQYLAELLSERDEVAGQIAEADELRNVELLTICETKLALLNKSISQHESNLRLAGVML